MAAGGGVVARKTSFYYSFLVLPADQRQAIVAVWDFCRAVDDAVDEAADRSMEESRAAVEEWRRELACCYGAGTPSTEQGRALVPFVQAFDLPRQAFEDVIDGVAMDLDHQTYETFEDLLEYCRRVASAVGMICIRIFRCQSPAATEYALHLGIALQLTNILRDVGDDLRRGRLYLPLEDMRAAGCSCEDLARQVVTEPVRRLLAFECERTRDYYRRAVDARPDEDRKRLVCAEIMRAVYAETLERVERSGYDVFSGRARVPRWRQAVIALRQWLLPR
jgi:phytoene synthase